MNTPALGFDDPKTQGILALAAGLLQGSGPSRTPVGFGQVLGQGLTSGLQGMQAAKLNNLQMAMLQAKAGAAKAEGLKDDAARAREERRLAIMNGGNAAAGATAGGPWSSEYASQNPSEAPWVQLETKGQRLIDADFIDDGKKLIETAKIMKDRLEFRDGVWYDKFTGKPVVGGHMVNKDGFGSLLNVGPGGQIGMGPMAGSNDRYLAQQRLGEQARAERALELVPATSPTAPPTYRSRESLLNAPVPGGAPAGSATPVAAGMSPVVAAGLAADTEQQKAVSLNFGKIFNDYQNASMANPAKIAKLKQIGTLLDGFEGGSLSGTGKEIASAASSLGVKIDAKLGNKEAAEAMSNEIALALRSTGAGEGMPGAMSEGDRKFLKEMAPSMSQSNAGRKQIIEARVKVMERENQVAGMARQYRQRYGKLDDGFFSQLQDWSNANPLFAK